MNDYLKHDEDISDLSTYDYFYHGQELTDTLLRGMVDKQRRRLAWLSNAVCGSGVIAGLRIENDDAILSQGMALDASGRILVLCEDSDLSELIPPDTNSEDELYLYLRRAISVLKGKNRNEQDKEQQGESEGVLAFSIVGEPSIEKQKTEQEDTVFIGSFQFDDGVVKPKPDSWGEIANLGKLKQSLGELDENLALSKQKHSELADSHRATALLLSETLKKNSIQGFSIRAENSHCSTMTCVCSDPIGISVVNGEDKPVAGFKLVVRTLTTGCIAHLTKESKLEPGPVLEVRTDDDGKASFFATPLTQSSHILEVRAKDESCPPIFIVLETNKLLSIHESDAQRAFVGENLDFPLEVCCNGEHFPEIVDRIEFRNSSHSEVVKPRKSEHSIVTKSDWRVRNVGRDIVLASAYTVDATEPFETIEFTVLGQQSRVEVLAGNSQSHLIDDELPNPIEILVADLNGEPIEDAILDIHGIGFEDKYLVSDKATEFGDRHRPITKKNGKVILHWTPQVEGVNTMTIRHIHFDERGRGSTAIQRSVNEATVFASCKTQNNKTTDLPEDTQQ